MAENDKKIRTKSVKIWFYDLAGAEGLEPSARGFGAKSTLSVKPRVEIHSLKIHIITALSGFESAVRFVCKKGNHLLCRWKRKSLSEERSDKIKTP